MIFFIRPIFTIKNIISRKVYHSGIALFCNCDEVYGALHCFFVAFLLMSFAIVHMRKGATVYDHIRCKRHNIKIHRMARH